MYHTSSNDRTEHATDCITRTALVRPLPDSPPTALPPPEPPPIALRAARLALPTHQPQTPVDRPQYLTDLVTFAIPLDKARSTTPTNDGYDYFPQGSISDPGIMLRPASPTTPFEFPFSLDEGQISPFPTNAFDAPRLPMNRVTRVVCLPRVFGLKSDSVAYARSMMDGGANICVTGILGLLVTG